MKDEHVPEITKEQFVKEYARGSNMTLEQLKKIRIPIPCDCDYEECKGWQMVNPKDYSYP